MISIMNYPTIVEFQRKGGVKVDKTKVQGKILGLEPPQSKRLASFCKAKRRDRDKVLFDDRMLSELEHIVKDKKWLHDVKDYLDGMGFCQSKYSAEVLQAQVERFCDSNHKYTGWNQHYKLAFHQLMCEFKHAELSPIIYNSKEKFMRSLPRVDTHAGFIFFESGMRTKGENADYIYQNWDSILELAIADGSFNLPIIPGMRTQASGAYDSEGRKTDTWKAKTRLVNMVDERVIMAETMFARPVQRYMSDVVSWYAGGKAPQWISRAVRTAQRDYGNVITIDYSAFDQSISNWLIHDAFKIVKQMFNPLTKQQEAIFDVIVNDFINKAFIDVNGKILYSHKGVPSGSMFTQIIDSIVNMLMVKTYLNHLGITKYRCLVMGDDNVIFTNSKLDLEDLAGYLQTMFGISVNPAKCSVADSKSKGVEFLSRLWMDGGEWRQPEVLVAKLLYPETFRDYIGCGFEPKHVIKSYFDTFILGMREMTKPLTEREYFYEVDTNADPSIKKHFLTGVERYNLSEQERRANDKFILGL